MSDQSVSIKLKINADGNVNGVVSDVNKSLDQFQVKLNSSEEASAKLAASIKRVGHYGSAAFAGLGLSLVMDDVVQATVEFQKLQASLVTVKGSVLEAERSFKFIQDFAQQTPYQLTEVTDAFIKMEAMGLTASEKAMRSYGDTASSMGKSLNQMIEAVADAATGEFERLKEFGIKASSEGDRVRFTFKGVTTEVGKNAAEIESYLTRLGEVNFSGGMARQMDTVGGKLSNLEDSWQRALASIGEQTQPVITQTIEGLSGLANTVEDLSDYIDEAAYVASIGLTVGLTAKAIPAIWATSTALNAASASAGGFMVAMRGATAAALAFSATPMGLAVTAMAGGVAYLALKEDEAEIATRELTTALREQGLELSNSELEARAAELVEYRQQLESLIEAKRQNSSIDVFNVKEKGIQDKIDSILNVKNSVEETTKAFIDLNAEVRDLIGLDLEAEFNDATDKSQHFADMESFISREMWEIKKQEEKEAKELSELRSKSLAEFKKDQEESWIQSVRQFHEEYRQELELDAKAEHDWWNARWEDAEYGEQLAEDGYRAQLKVAQALAESEKELIERRTKEYEQMVERIDGVFVDIWRDVIDGTDNAFEAISNMFKQLLAEMAHQAITKPIMLNVMGSVGLGNPATGQAGGFDIGGLGNVSSLFDSGSMFSGSMGSWMASGIGSLAGYGGVAAGGQAAMLASQTAAFGSTGSALTASAAGASGIGLGSSLMAVAPYAAAFLAIDALMGGQITKGIGTGITGGSWEYRDHGMTLDAGRGGVDANSYLYQRKDGGWFRKSKGRTKVEDMPEFEAAYSAVVAGMLDQLDANANELGYDLADNFTTTFKTSFKDMDDAEIEQAIADSLSTIYQRAVSSVDGLGDYLSDFQYAGEELYQTLDRLTMQTDSVSELLALTGQVFGRGDKNSIAQNLIEMSGGLDALSASTSRYYQAFYSESEQFNNLTGSIKESLWSQKMILPVTRDSYRDLVESLKLGGEAAQRQYTALMNLSSAADEYYKKLEQQQVDYLQSRMEVVNTEISMYADLSSLLVSASQDLVGSVTASSFDYMSAQSVLSDALTKAKRGSNFDMDSIKNAVSVVSSNDASGYATYEDFQRDQLATASLLDDLNRYTLDAMSIEEQMLDKLQQQIDILQGIERDTYSTARSLAVTGTVDNPDTGGTVYIRPAIPQFAKGGIHSGGLRLVGEQGPELEFTGPSRIFNASDTRNMLDQSEVVAELRKMREELVQVKSAGVATAYKLDKIARLNSKWDAVGLKTEAAQ